MPDQPFIDRLMADISGRLPTDLGGLRNEVERNVRSVLAEAVSRLDLITREEFDIQQQVLTVSYTHLTLPTIYSV